TLLGGLPEAGPAVGVVAPGAGHGQRRVGLALVSDVVRLQLVGGVEVGDRTRREALLTPQVLRQLEVSGRLGCRWGTSLRPGHHLLRGPRVAAIRALDRKSTRLNS